MSKLGFGNQSDFDLQIASLGPLLVFLLEIWSDKSLNLRFHGLIFCLAALLREGSHFVFFFYLFFPKRVGVNPKDKIYLFILVFSKAA